MFNTKDFVLNDPLAKFDRERTRIEVQDRFETFLSASEPWQTVGALSPFATKRPWKYWDTEKVVAALTLLETDRVRTIQALRVRRDALDRGMQSLFRPSPIVFVEDTFSRTQSKGLIRLATEFLPEYLRWAEHIFGNLLEVYWSVIKRKGVDGKFDIRGALAVFEKKKLENLLHGYREPVRNAIAHGNFCFTGFSIEFGKSNPETLASTEFLRLFDDLCRTCNSLCIGLLIFWSRHEPWSELGASVPLAIIERFASGGLNRSGLELLGVVESNTPLTGKQLHAAVKMEVKSRISVLGECSRVATQLIQAGAASYDRFVVEIDHGEQVGSVAIILPQKFKEILDSNKPIDDLVEAFSETQLLWFDESRIKSRLCFWRTILSAGVKNAQLEIWNNWRESGLWIGKGRYQIRGIENTSSQGIARIRIRAVLKNPSDAKNKELVNEVINEIVKSWKRKFIRSRGQYLDKGIPFPKRPHYIFIDLFKVDGTLRWLKGGGWMAGNTVAIAEWVKGKHTPVYVDNPENIYKGTRIRYTIDNDKAQQALADLAKIMTDINKRSAQIKSEK